MELVIKEEAANKYGLISNKVSELLLNKNYSTKKN